MTSPPIAPACGPGAGRADRRCRRRRGPHARPAGRASRSRWRRIPQVAAARAEEAAADAQRRQVDAARWPIVTLDAGVGAVAAGDAGAGDRRAVGRAAVPGPQALRPVAAFLADLSVIQPLYTFGKIALRGEAAAHGLRAREAQTRMQRADVAFEVARIYEGYLLARDADRFLDETATGWRARWKAAQERLSRRSAASRERDVLRLQAAQGLAAMGLNQARAGMAQARAGLVAYLGLPAGERSAFAEEELLPVGRRRGRLRRRWSSLASDRRPELDGPARGAEGARRAGARPRRPGSFPTSSSLAFVSVAYTPGRDWLQTGSSIDPLNHFIPGALVGAALAAPGRAWRRARAREQRAQRRGARGTPASGPRRHPGRGPPRLRGRRARATRTSSRGAEAVVQGQAVDGAGVGRLQHRVPRHPRGVRRRRGLRDAADRGHEGALRPQRRDGGAVEGGRARWTATTTSSTSPPPAKEGATMRSQAAGARGRA